MNSDYILECCVDCVASACAAQNGGANRLELCSGLIIGGTTPTTGLLSSVKEHVNIPVYVLMRPRFGDFLYTEEEFDVICRDLTLLKQAGADGFVIGCLNPDGSLCMEQTEKLISLCDGKPVTLHRAFDMCSDPYGTYEAAGALGITTILTSGQRNTCLEGLGLLKRLSSCQNGPRIMAGSGVNAEVISTLLAETSLTAFHMSGKKVLQSAMTFRNPNVSMGTADLDEYSIWQTDTAEIKKAADVLRRPK